MKHLLLLFMLIISTFAFSQDKKIEREEDIERSQMPEKAQKYLKGRKPENLRKLRFYYETDGDKESYEAKFKYKGNRFSVEFNELGTIEDIEVQVKKRNLNKEVRKKIESYLDSKHDRFKIEKIQLQYLPKGDNPAKIFQKAIDHINTIPDNFELIVATKNNGKLKKFEMLFDPNGNFEKEREIIRNSYDYLIF